MKWTTPGSESGRCSRTAAFLLVLLLSVLPPINIQIDGIPLHGILWAGETATDALGGRAVLSSWRFATLSSEVNYPITKIHRHMGQTFREGDILVEMDDEVARANVLSAEAARAAADASLQAVTDLYSSNNASAVELGNAKRDLAAAAARLILAQRDLRACTVRAPFDGRVSDVLVQEYELVSRGTPLLVVVDDSRLFVKFLLPDTGFGSVAIGDSLDVSIPAAAGVFPARISHLAAVMDPASRTFDVWALVENPDGLLRAGMSATLRQPEPAQP